MFTHNRFGPIGLVIVLMLLGSGAHAQQTQPNNTVAPPRPNREMRSMMMRRRGMHRGLRQLNLTEQQRQQMRSLAQSQSQSTQALRQELRQLAQKRRAGNLTDAETARMKELRQQMMQSRQAAHSQMQGLLTPEQKAKLDEMKMRRANRGKPGPA